MYINIIELLESIKDACSKQTSCENCPFAGTYRHKGCNTNFYYCKIAEMPSGWQIDSGRDAEILRDISDLEKYYNAEYEMDDTISRQAAIKHLTRARMLGDNRPMEDIFSDIQSITPVPKMGHCNDCKWWKDSDGAYRRGVGAESQCPINHRKVYEGNGYCFLFEAKMEV